MKITKLCSLGIFFALGSPLHAEEAIKPSGQPLKIVFLMGQSNMVGMAKIDTAWYLTQPQYHPPREAMVKRSKTYDWTDLYWAGIQYFDGAKEDRARLDELWEKRGDLRTLWRKRVRGNAGPWQESWGVKPEPRQTGKQIHAGKSVRGNHRTRRTQQGADRTRPGDLSSGHEAGGFRQLP